MPAGTTYAQAAHHCRAERPLALTGYGTGSVVAVGALVCAAAGDGGGDSAIGSIRHHAPRARLTRIKQTRRTITTYKSW